MSERYKETTLAERLVGLGLRAMRYADDADIKTISEAEELARKPPSPFGWLIEIHSAAYLAVRCMGHQYDFYWTEDHAKALRFLDEDQADLTMMAIRAIRPDLFPAALPRAPRPVEHKWLAAA